MTEHVLTGVTVPLVTPFDAGDKPNAEPLGRLLDHLRDGGITALMLCGSNGEGHAVADDDLGPFVEAVSAAWRTRAGGSAIVTTAISAASTTAAVRRGRTAVEAGADALVVSPPYYFHHPADELVEHFAAVDALGAPWIAYNIPRYTGNPLTVSVLTEVSRFANCVGLKDSSGDLGFVGEAVTCCGRPGFMLSQGAEAHLVAGMIAGAGGLTPGLALLAPRCCVALFEAARAGDLDTAHRRQADLNRLAAIHTIRPGIAATKAALGQLGVLNSRPAAPVRTLNEDERHRLAELLAKVADVTERPAAPATTTPTLLASPPSHARNQEPSVPPRTPLSSETLRGVWASVLLPFDQVDRIDDRRLENELATLAGSGVDGIYAHGTAGEFHLLTDPEFDHVTGLLAAACTEEGAPFQIGVSHPIPQITIDRIARTRDLNPAAYQVILPDWVTTSDAEAEAFLDRVARVAAPVPLVLYNPPHAKTRLGPAQLERVLDSVPAIIGLKVADGDDEWYSAMRPILDRCPVFVPGHHLATGLAHGARGSYSNIAALSPHGAARWYKLIQANPSTGADVERRIAEFFTEHIAPQQRLHRSAPALDKFLAAVGAWCDAGLRVRWPYIPVNSDSVHVARRRAHELLPEILPAIEADTAPA